MLGQGIHVELVDRRELMRIVLMWRATYVTNLGAVGRNGDLPLVRFGAELSDEPVLEGTLLVPIVDRTLYLPWNKRSKDVFSERRWTKGVCSVRNSSEDPFAVFKWPGSTGLPKLSG